MDFPSRFVFLTNRSFQFFQKLPRACFQWAMDPASAKSPRSPNSLAVRLRLILPYAGEGVGKRCLLNDFGRVLQWWMKEREPLRLSSLTAAPPPHFALLYVQECMRKKVYVCGHITLADQTGYFSEEGGFSTYGDRLAQQTCHSRRQSQSASLETIHERIWTKPSWSNHCFSASSLYPTKKSSIHSIHSLISQTIKRIL